MQNYRWIDTRLNRMIGAQFKKSLNGEVLVFSYPHTATHLFHTMWCPPLRIVVVDTQPENGRVVFDRVVEPWHFVNLPAGNLVLEMDPDTDCTEILQSILNTSQKKPHIPDDLPVGGTDSSISIHLIIYQMFADSLCDLRKVKDNCLTREGTINHEKLKQKYAPWDRGQIYASAGFVLDYSADSNWSLPRSVIPLSREVLRCEQEDADEILAAMSGAIPSWRLTLRAVCIGCSRGGTWRSVLPIPPGMAPEVSWRLLRPENHIPLCKYCARRYDVHRKPQIRLELANAFWGPRFTALERWYDGARGLEGGLPKDWNKYTHPLWPETFGGDTWEAGSGASIHTLPEWPKEVQRTPQQIEYLKRVADWDVIVHVREKSCLRLETYMNFFIFMAALFFTVTIYELINLFTVLLKGRRVNVITFAVVDDGVNLPTQRRRTTLEAVLLAALPKRFDPNVASTTDIMALLRRSGYYYANPGEFFAAAIRDFSQYLLVGAGLAVALVILGMPIAAVPILAIYIALGLRRPYARLKKIAKKREDAMKNNMLLGLSVLESLLSVSTSAQQAFTQTAQIGGPFCNLLALLSAQISKLPPEDAVAVVKAHLPNPRDVEANLFLNDVLAYFKESRRILSGVKALRHSVHRLVLDATEERAALVRQRANLFGIFAIVGLLFALILPYMGLSF